MAAIKKVGLIAGGGQLPHTVIAGATEQGIPVFLAALTGFASPDDFDTPGKSFGIAEFGGLIKAFKAEKCSHVCFAGTVTRPEFKSLKPDMGTLKRMPGALNAAAKGDDALLSYIVKNIEDEGFEVIAPQDLCASALIEAGPLGSIKPNEKHKTDIDKALMIAGVIGEQDIGQGAVVCNGLVLAVEAQEGTDEMLRRVADLQPELRGTRDARAGVLAKRLKPGQESRVDLPTIGVNTVELAAAAGLAGIVLKAGRAFVMDKQAVRDLADQYGLFIIGQKPDDG
jgi:DUF1009 family protein